MPSPRPWGRPPRPRRRGSRPPSAVMRRIVLELGTAVPPSASRAASTGPPPPRRCRTPAFGPARTFSSENGPAWSRRWQFWQLRWRIGKDIPGVGRRRARPDWLIRGCQHGSDHQGDGRADEPVSPDNRASSRVNSKTHADWSLVLAARRRISSEARSQDECAFLALKYQVSLDQRGSTSTLARPFTKQNSGRMKTKAPRLIDEEPWP